MTAADIVGAATPPAVGAGAGAEVKLGVISTPAVTAAAAIARIAATRGHRRRLEGSAEECCVIPSSLKTLPVLLSVVESMSSPNRACH